ncbi:MULTISPECIES: polyprenyl synthetase family protein [Psychrobacter]|jgi:octaprenyl-diphosphate synthase|uniref:polyprenyl synthetase family protein n=1 Tax=Psychrobacter TaxID=497 RepID=UPI00086962A3|nr:MULTISPECIES: polyprenyl synthetase family protein [Psychrobacter]MBA6244440.1 polyprenyl synthetase family protein [Psychrobacter sp. Urea-trap-18]MBA6287060.1 polyprenyl synthetase family protein [Psychrobacter sp. Urea-trap-16]MBA6319303.1 polyprenyl synthetase family protein [Psychrobacter sp. Urea-trap-20]MBA6335521.1 polyprenyl synthetase family protein [Psychrobacter sp. Urea-trap-19]OEH67159.1 MAG: geranylgeranyl diphosphate synthase [Psychrobacter sp. B29-1]|tara:strand:+ start:497 stop:1522 length:1026 start_codon:yes stop_codon:yes gene_type:complete
MTSTLLDNISPTSQSTLTYADIQNIVADDFEIMDKQVFGSLNSKVQLVMSVSQHVINAGGKRMRPLITLLCARMLNDAPSQQAMHLAAITEMLHTATLVHDDVIDESGQRRGKPTANATWDNATAVLVGDYLIARAFNLLVGFQSLPLLQVFSDGTCDIAEGEVLQLQHQHNPAATETDYLNIIDGKTSRLFMMATQGAAILQDKTEYMTALGDFGQHFGNAFQIIDDVLDYSGDSELMGKNLGDDLAEGKPTLPTIKALELLKDSDKAGYEQLRVAVQTGKTPNAEQLIELVRTSGSLDYCKLRALEETKLAQQALSTLPDNRYRQGLHQLTELASARLL